MKFRVIRTDYHPGVADEYPCVTSFGYEKESTTLEYVNIESIDELMRLVDALDLEVVIHTDLGRGEPRILEIYDDYRE